MTDGRDAVARLEFEPVRRVFPNEARDFTAWMEANLEILVERLGIPLSVVEREKSVGDFSVDLLCEDDTGRPVIIENQLEKTDHDHLGKLLTYLVNLDASTAIWVTREPRQEHIKVIDWLNENTAADLAFYLVKIETVRIGQSQPAPLFTVLAGPSAQAKTVGGAKKEWAAQDHQRMSFWKRLLDKSRSKTDLFAKVSPGRQNWLATGAGRTGVMYNYYVRKAEGAIDLYIDHDQDSGEENKAIFDVLYAQREDIEREFGSALKWHRMDGKRASRIEKRLPGRGFDNPESWDDLQEQMIDGMIRLVAVTRDRMLAVKV